MVGRWWLDVKYMCLAVGTSVLWLWVSVWPWVWLIVLIVDVLRLWKDVGGMCVEIVYIILMRCMLK